MKFSICTALTLAAFGCVTDASAQTPAASGPQSLVLVSYVMKDDGPVGATTTSTVMGQYASKDACVAAANAGIYLPGPGGAKFFNWGFFCIPSGK